MPIDAEDLDRYLEAPLKQQIDAAESALEKLDEIDFEKVDDACRKLVGRLQYANIKYRITYNDGLEILAKLGMFLSLVNKNQDVQNG